MGYNFATKAFFEIVKDDDTHVFPHIYENIIIWADQRDCADPNNKNSYSNIQVWGYNLDTKKEFQITNVPNRPKISFRIWGDNVFVEMTQTTSGGIYMSPLPPEAK